MSNNNPETKKFRRRDLLKYASLTAAGLALPFAPRVAKAENPTQIPENGRTGFTVVEVTDPAEQAALEAIQDKGELTHLEELYQQEPFVNAVAGAVGQTGVKYIDEFVIHVKNGVGCPGKSLHDPDKAEFVLMKVFRGQEAKEIVSIIETSAGDFIIYYLHGTANGQRQYQRMPLQSYMSDRNFGSAFGELTHKGVLDEQKVLVDRGAKLTTPNSDPIKYKRALKKVQDRLKSAGGEETCPGGTPTPNPNGEPNTEPVPAMPPVVNRTPMTGEDHGLGKIINPQTVTVGGLVLTTVFGFPLLRHYLETRKSKPLRN